MLSLEEKTLAVGRRMRRMYLKDTHNGEESSTTRFSTGFDDLYWYFRFECVEDNFCPKHSEYNRPLYEGDIVEVLITLEEKNRYLEIEVNQNNANYCAIIDNKDGFKEITINLLTENPIKSTVNIMKNKWTCDILIALDKLYELGLNPTKTFLNAHRQDFDKDGNLRLYSLSPTYSDTFHRTDAFVKANFA